LLPPPTSTRFPYTTLFRSVEGWVPRVGGTPPELPFPLVFHDDRKLGQLVSELGGVVVVAPLECRRPGTEHGVDGRRQLGCVLNRSEEHTSELQSRENLVCR